MRTLLPILALLALGLTGGAVAEDAVWMPDYPIKMSPTARFIPLARDLEIAPGARMVRHLDLFGMERVSLQAVGNSVAGEGILRIGIGFGPPHVPAAGLALEFPGREVAAASEVLPVKGPRMVVVFLNDRPHPVKLTAAVYATD